MAVQLTILLITFVLCIWLCNQFLSKSLFEHDDGHSTSLAEFVDQDEEFVQSSNDDPNSGYCPLFLGISSIPGAGRGIFAGQSYLFDEIVDWNPSIFLPTDLTVKSVLNNYVYSAREPDMSMLIFGSGSLFNHAANNSVFHYWGDNSVEFAYLSQPPAALAAHQFAFYKTTKDIEYGEEMYGWYGETWFSDLARISSGQPGKPYVSYCEGNEESADTQLGGKQLNHTSSEAIVELDSTGQVNTPISCQQQVTSLHPSPSLRVRTHPTHLLRQPLGHCLTHVNVQLSIMPFAACGLFATRSFRKGEILAISPVLMIDKDHLIDFAPDNLLMNYILSKPDSKVGLLPLSYPAMMNHYKRFHIEVIKKQRPETDDPADAQYGEVIDFNIYATNQTDQEEGHRYTSPNAQIRWFDWYRLESSGLVGTLPDYMAGSDDGGETGANQDAMREVVERYRKRLLASGMKPLPELFEMEVEELMSQKYSLFDIAYVASRDIEEGEELYLDYGEKWEKAFIEYLYKVNKGEVREEDFRGYVEVEDGFFPSNWFE